MMIGAVLLLSISGPFTVPEIIGSMYWITVLFLLIRLLIARDVCGTPSPMNFLLVPFYPFYLVWWTIPKMYAEMSELFRIGAHHYLRARSRVERKSLVVSIRAARRRARRRVRRLMCAVLVPGVAGMLFAGAGLPRPSYAEDVLRTGSLRAMPRAAWQRVVFRRSAAPPRAARARHAIRHRIAPSDHDHEVRFQWSGVRRL